MKESDSTSQHIILRGVGRGGGKNPFLQLVSDCDPYLCICVAGSLSWPSVKKIWEDTTCSAGSLHKSFVTLLQDVGVLWHYYVCHWLEENYLQCFCISLHKFKRSLVLLKISGVSTSVWIVSKAGSLSPKLLLMFVQWVWNWEKDCTGIPWQ